MSQQGGIACGQYVQCGGAVGAVRWRSPGVVTVNTPAPACCMKSLSGCRQNFGRLLSVSQKSRNEKCYLRELL
jgi:hypothetical protein